MSISDDFAATTLSGTWTVVTPPGTSVNVGSDPTDSYLELVTPDGNYDVWGVNNGVRAMQAVTDTDFALETRFLTTPTERYEMQGILVEQGAQNWIRFDTYSDGNTLRAFASVTVDGVSQVALNIAVPQDTSHLRVVREGNMWTYLYSPDGQTWAVAGSFTYDLTVSSVGVFAGNSSSSDGYTAQIDYVAFDSDPIEAEDGVVIPNLVPLAGDDAVQTDQDVAVQIAWADLLANDSDGDGETLTVVSWTSTSEGTLVDNGDGTLTYTPSPGYSGADSFTYTITDGEDEATATVAIGVLPPPGPPVSDDFHSGLDPAWRIEGPAGTSATMETADGESYLALTTSEGNHDLWNGGNNTARVLQTVADGDMSLEAKFLTTPTERYEMQGILVEQDAQNWIRFDTYSDVGVLRAFAAVTVNGSSVARINVVVPGGAAPYLRVDRDGDTWSFYHSTDGMTWTLAGSFDQALTVAGIGPYAGSTSGAGGFTAHVDYFESSTDRLVSEDGVVIPNLVPLAGDDAVQTDQDVAVQIAWADLLANDSDGDGETLTVVSWTSTSEGTLVDNGDGTLTYTPSPGYSGADSFTYTITDGEDEATATVAIGVLPPPGPPVSDDFHSGLDPAWRIEGPAGTSATMETADGESYLALTTSEGNHDLWNGGNNTARVLQTVADGDMSLEAKFLTTPTERYEMQGILVEQDAQNWIRFDTYSDVGVLRAFAAVTVNGSSVARINVVVPGGAAPYLRVDRDGDTWSFYHSTDGMTWTLAGSFDQALTVAGIGPYAGSTSGAGGFTAHVDYFESSTDRLVSEDGVVIPNLVPLAGDDAVQTDQDVAVQIAWADLLANDSDGDGETLTVVSWTSTSEGTLVDNGDGTLTYTPSPGYSGADSFTYTITDGEDEATATVAIGVLPPPGPPVSDDFHSGLDPAWRIEGPAGTSATMETADGESYLALTTSEGNHDLWNGGNNTARVLQTVADGDMSLEAKFLTTPTERYEMQGILVEQDAQNWIRFDTYSDVGVLRAFAAVTVNGSSVARINVVVPGGAAPYLRVDRDGDTWSFYHSTDGMTWTLAGSFDQALTVAGIGPYAGSTSGAGGFTAHVDYFESSTDRLVSEDGVVIPNLVPLAGDDAVQTDQDVAVQIAWADLLANDSDGDGETLTVVSWTSTSEGTLVDNGDGTLTYTPSPGYSGADSFTYTITDGEDEATATVAIGVLPPPGPPVSDDFHSGLDPAWRIEGPAGTSSVLGSAGEEAFLSLITPDGDYDIWGANNGARALQRIADTDFEVEVGFVNTPTEAYQMQGILVEADADNWIRFDTVFKSGQLHVFAAVTTAGISDQRINVGVPNDTDHLKVNRQGNVWTLEYSLDGVVWTPAGSFTHAIPVTAVGVFAGNKGAADGYTSFIDYFQNTADPLLLEDGRFAQDDAISLRADVPLVIDVEGDLFANDAVPGSASLVLDSVSQSTNGDVTVNPDGTLTYTPNPGYAGPDAFTYTVTDGTLTDTATVNLRIDTPAISDDFAGGALDPAWSFEGIAGFAQIATNATDGFLEIHSPQGVVVSASGTLTTPRVLQSVPDEDFQIAAGFLSVPMQKYQEQGLLVIEDEANWIRFDVAFTGSTRTLIVGVIENGATSYPLVQATNAEINHMRVTRTGDDWVFEHSADGSTWIEAFEMSHAMNVSQTGVFAGSNSFDSEPPGYVGLIDYFENSLFPISGEDSVLVPTNVAPLAADDTLGLVAADVPLDIDIAADLMTNDSDSNDDLLTFAGVSQPGHGTIVDNGDGTLTYVPDASFQGLDSFTYTISDGSETATATVDMIVGSPIVVWYGSDQTFGALGEPQEWVNVLGTVALDGVSSLSYRLNGGAEVALRLGGDGRRLQSENDFNVELSFDDLDPTAADDTLELIARTNEGETYTRTVTLAYEDGADWAGNYSIDWAQVTDLQDVVQVVDGYWGFDANGVRPLEPGYDRLLAIGDDTWDFYEVALTVELHDITTTNARHGSAFAFGMLWGGHTDEPVGGQIPHIGWENSAGFYFWSDEDVSRDRYYGWGGNRFSLVDLEEGETYNVKIRLEHDEGLGKTYSIKIWNVLEAEPVDWLIQASDGFGEPVTGSFLMNAHYFDVTFGDVTVTPIEGSDIIPGRDTSDMLVAVNVAEALPGQGELDVFTGGAGADTFVFGADGVVYYDDGIAAEQGLADYALIWDFEVGLDQIRLAGSAADYTLTEAPASLAAAGTALWLQGQGGAEDELIAVIRDVSGLELTGSSFLYDTFIA